jgi:hypothetical protein
MDRQIKNAASHVTDSGRIAAVKDPTKPYHTGHLMCRTSLWGLAGFLGCAYFAWVSFGHVAHNQYDWPHDLWTAATYLVWILLLTGLALDTRCLRERIFFGVLVINFLIGGVLTLWYSAPASAVRMARIVTGILWATGALASLTTLGRANAMRREN